jgi:hypothetical protein
MEPEVQDALGRVIRDFNNEIFKVQGCASRIKYDVADLCRLTTALLALSFINLVVVLACAFELTEIVRSVNKIKSAQTEVKQ